MSEPHLFCFGLGYTAHRFARNMVHNGWRVSGTHRTLEACEKERTFGITAHIFDEYLPLENIWDLQTVTHILISIPPDKQMGDIVLAHHLEDVKKLPHLKWIGYLSTTGVYGNHDGNWVDEDTPVNPENDRTKRRVQAENDWLETGLPVHIFRLSGIYGPNRNVLKELEQGTAHHIVKDGQFFSRIHVDDITSILEQSIQKPNPLSIYNCADDYPCSSSEVVTYGASLLGVSAPPATPFEHADLSDMAKSFYRQNRRVRNNKIKEELGLKLNYPNYKEGLKSFLS